MSRVQLAFASVLVALYVATVIAAISNPDLIGLATAVTPVVLVPVGAMFTKGIRDQLRKDRKDDVS